MCTRRPVVGTCTCSCITAGWSGIFVCHSDIFDFFQIISLARKIVRYLPDSHSFCLCFFVAGVIQYYVDTVKLMALRQLVAGSPLRTLCLLIAGQPAEVFSTNATGHGGLHGDFSTPQQPVQVRYWCMNCHPTMSRAECLWYVDSFC
jgi:hypothetical protein